MLSLMGFSTENTHPHTGAVTPVVVIGGDVASAVVKGGGADAVVTGSGDVAVVKCGACGDGASGAGGVGSLVTDDDDLGRFTAEV